MKGLVLTLTCSRRRIDMPCAGDEVCMARGYANIPDDGGIAQVE